MALHLADMFYSKNKNKVRKQFPDPNELRKGDRIKILNKTRLVSISDGSMIRYIDVDEVVTYRGRAKNPLWNCKWTKLETEDGTVGIVIPNAMPKNFIYVEE